MCAPLITSRVSSEQQPQQHRPKLRRRPSPASITATSDLTSRSPSPTSTSADSSKAKPTKSVSFGFSVAVRLIPTHHELTDAQYVSMYYTQSDLEEARTDGLSDIRALRSAVPEATAANDFAGPCYRGIEHLASRQAKADRAERRRSYVDAVLVEQYKQTATRRGVADMNDLAAVAAARSANDAIVARSKGMADEDSMKSIVGEKVVSRARALAARKGELSSQRKLAFITGAVRKVRIGTVRTEDYALENARSA